MGGLLNPLNPNGIRPKTHYKKTFNGKRLMVCKVFFLFTKFLPFFFLLKAANLYLFMVTVSILQKDGDLSEK